MTMDNELVLFDVDADGVATFTLNEPAHRNGWSAAMENRYFDLLRDADADPAVRAAVLTGAGTSFCPGLNMDRLHSIAGQTLDLSGRRPQYTPRLFRKPLIGAINGACAGIGLVQALQCDVRFAAAGARFSTAFARRGLGAEYNMSWVLPRLVGVENALDLLLSGRTFDAEEAHQLGLVSRVVDPDNVLSCAQEYARDIARNCSPIAVALIKHQVLADLDVGFEQAMLRSARVMGALNGGADVAEGVASFREKRPPSFAPLGVDLDPEEVTRSVTPGARLTVPELLAGDGDG
jgi:enoyl-CoA hydratase/carnithine racemase